MSYKSEMFFGRRIDVYRVLKLFQVTDPVMQHIIKKAIRFGRGSHKSRVQELDDMKEAINRAIALEAEELEHQKFKSKDPF